MTIEIADRVFETSTTQGTGTLNLGGAPTGFQSFVSGVGDGNQTYYHIDDGENWESGIGTVTSGSPDTLSRDTIIASSNSNAAVNWGAGTRNVRCTVHAGVFPTLRADQTFTGDNVFSGDVEFQGDVTLVGLVPAGCVLPFAGTSAPTGFLFAYGQAVSRTTYAALFSAIGTTYGTGDGSTTFNLPDLRGRVVAGKDDMGGSSADRLTDQSGGLDGDTLGDTGGSETHTLIKEELPNYNLVLGTKTASDFNKSGGATAEVVETAGSSTTSENIPSGGSDDPHNNVQPTIILNYIIKT